ncbi:MAG TPA: peptidoglycan DD-metalloendopeptidase family protein, partial [Ramlibacter sp.]
PGGTVVVQPAPSAAPAVVALPGAENAGRPGYYTVKPGDTLIRIALENGQNWRDVARWSNLDNPNVIEVGQVLRVAPPGPVPPTVTAQAGVPLPPAGAASAPLLPASAAASAPRGTVTAATPSTTGTPVPAEEEIAWSWPTATGAVLAGFDEQKNKGLDIGGRAGEPVLAAADGRVVYAGAGLRGYGNLIILKHNNTYLTAYAHNQSLAVKEDQNVRKGQKIAEMGATDSDRVKLHFEIRRQGKPVDPSRYLPAR